MVLPSGKVPTRGATFPPQGGKEKPVSPEYSWVVGWMNGYGALAQLGERLHGMQEVSGSIPLGSTIHTMDFA